MGVFRLAVNPVEGMRTLGLRIGPDAAADMTGEGCPPGSKLQADCKYVPPPVNGKPPLQEYFSLSDGSGWLFRFHPVDPNHPPLLLDL